MSRVRSFFLREADECLATLRAEMERQAMDVATMYGAVRHFRGSAQMARFGALARTARMLERRLRPGGGAGPRDELRAEVARVLESLHDGVEAVREGLLEEDPRMEAGMGEQEEVEPAGDRVVVPIETLEYRGRQALERALSLREPLEDAIVSADSVGPVLDELFDLIRLGAK